MACGKSCRGHRLWRRLGEWTAFVDVDMAICLIILTFAPAVTVVGYEILGHRHQTEALAKESAATSIGHQRMHMESALPLIHRHKYF